MKSALLKISFVLLVLCFLVSGCEKEEELSTGDYILIKDVNAKVFKYIKSLDANNQPKDYDWAITTNIDYLNLAETPIDDNILAPQNLADDFKISGLKIVLSGKKYLKKNQVLTSPNFRTGFGYDFEITEIKKLN